MTFLSRLPIVHHPLRFGVMVIGVVSLVDALLYALSGRLVPGLPITVIGIITGMTLSTLAAVAITALGWWHPLGFTQRGDWRRLVPFALFVLYGLLPLSAGVQAAPGALLAGALMGLLIGFWKIAVLGMLLYAFMPLGEWRATSSAALLVGTMHLGGLLVGGALVPTLLLSLSYLFMAFAFGAAWVRTGLIWPLVISNALLIMSAAATQVTEAPNLVVSAESILPAVFVSLVLAVYGVLLLRKRSRVMPTLVTR